MVYDMISHQKAEDELKRLNSFLSMLVESMPASIYTCRAEGDFGATYISGNIESLTGYSPEEFTSVSSFWRDRIHPDDRQRVFNNLPALFEKGHHEHEYRWRIADGSYKWFYDMLRLIKGPDGKTSHMVGTFVDITARKKAERELVIARREWENIFQAIGHPVIILDPGHNIIAANRAAVQVSGSAPEELAGKKCYEIYHGSVSPPQCCPMDRMLLSGSLETEEMEIEALNGIYLVSCTPVMDDEGKLEKVIHIATDITDRKRSEEKIRESGEKFKSIFNNSNDGILIADIESRKFLMANRKILEMLGYQEEELLQMGIFDIHPEDSMAYVISEFEKQAAGEKTLAEKVPVKGKDGKVFYCDISSYPLELEGGKCMVGVFRDITERMHAEEEYRTIIKTSMDGFWALDTEGNIVDMNEAYCRISGYSREELLRMNVREIDLRESPEEISSHIREVMKEGSDRFETSHRTRDGRSIELEISSYYSGHKGGRFYAFMRDITDKKRLEAQLMHAQKMEAVGQLAGGVAHDFNNILTAVTGYTRLLKLRAGDNEQLDHYIDQINFVSGRGADLVRSLLTFSRKQEIVLRPVDFNTAVLNAEKIMNKLIGEKIELHMRLHEKDLFVLADGGQLEQVLMNLATNARDAMPDGGVLSIETGTLEIDNAYIRDHGYGAPGMHAAITVTDTGEGMDADLLKKIFDPFFTTKGPEKGTGLGLAISYSIIKQHNGHINVYSEPGRGTSFKIYLPMIEKADGLTVSQGTAELRGGTETILLAEDDVKVRRALREILEEYGYTVT
ncbi:MAG: PAS domain S-box protein, partial [Nitrospirota bacterium]|nr:PAS domain S-box protein [Nitrospirota bacterium]